MAGILPAMSRKRTALSMLLATILLLAMWWVSIRPSNDRDWTADQTILSSAFFEGKKVTVRNIRNFSYVTKSDYTPAYYDKTFDLDTVKRVWYIVEPFSGFPGAAHTFLSFEFNDDEFLAISVEIRKEKGESFSPFKGLLKSYELMYVAGDERDLIMLRSNYRKDEVFVYPMKASQEGVRALLVDMLERMNTLADRPEFYNSITNTCTTNIASHVNAISPGKVPFSLKILLPADSDELAYDLGLIDTELSFEDARKRFRINERAEKYADDPDFSVKIRTDE